MNRLFLLIMTCLWLACWPRAGQADSLSIEGIRYGTHGQKTRIVFDLNTTTEFRSFLLADPARLVVDMPHVKWGTASSAIRGQDPIKGYRSGHLHSEGLVRIVFDLGKPAIIDKAFTLPAQSGQNPRLVIDLAPVSRALFMARLQDVFGNKTLRRSPTTAQTSVSTLAQTRQQRTQSIAVPGRKPRHTTKKTAAKKQYIVVVDAGHGGRDPGAISGRIHEKNITLSVAKKLRTQLEQTGRYKVVMTRTNDRYIKLRTRLGMSRQADADAFISIHADKIGRSNVRGASIYTLSENASDAETARLAERENNAGYVAGVDLASESEDVAGILLDLAMREKMNESGLLAQMMEKAFRKNDIRLLSRARRSAGFAVLKAPDIPAILVETGFLSNKQEARLLSSSRFQKKLAVALQQGLDAYFRKMQALQKIH